MRAFVAEKGESEVQRGLRDLDAGELGEGDVLVRVEYSSVNCEISLDEVDEALEAILAGKLRGRTVVRVSATSPE